MNAPVSRVLPPPAPVHAEGHGKRRIALRYRLHGKGWFQAARALDMAEKYHTGIRRSGCPEMSHQIAIATYVYTLTPWLLHPEETVSIALLHDIREDYDISDADLRDVFGNFVADGVDAVTKTFGGIDRNPDQVQDAIAHHAGASIVKPADRIHNHQTLLGTASPQKIASYLDETTLHVLPVLKSARRRFPEQEPAYENLKLILLSQVELLRAVIGVEDVGEAE